MLGAIIGDIVGLVYEWHNIKTKEFPFFGDGCHFTDDTVMTIATADALMNGGSKNDFIDAYKKWGRMYPNAGYGGGFRKWLSSDSREPYNSFGNGSAMRVSPVGFYPRDFLDAKSVACSVQTLSTDSASVTHNHPEGIKGANAVADCIMFLRYAKECNQNIDDAKSELRQRMTERFGYELTRTLYEIRPTYRFNECCQDTVPQAITAFLESTDFEDAIRNAISLGGDSDTLAAIVGGIAEAAYGIPEWIKEKALAYLDSDMKSIVIQFADKYCHLAQL